MMAAMGVPRATIAACVPTPQGLGIPVAKLNERFRNELDTGRAVVNAMVASRLLKAAMACVTEVVDPDTGELKVIDVKQAGVNAAMFWLRGQGAFRTAGERDPSDLYRLENQDTEEELEKLESMGAAELQRAIADKLSRKG